MPHNLAALIQHKDGHVTIAFGGKTDFKVVRAKLAKYRRLRKLEHILPGAGRAAYVVKVNGPGVSAHQRPSHPNAKSLQRQAINVPFIVYTADARGAARNAVLPPARGVQRTCGGTQA